MIIDAHAHLWKEQKGKVDGRDVTYIENGKSNFGGDVRQMMPPYMTDGYNSVERFIANMDYAGVNGAVITQEEIDGNQNKYLLEAKSKFPNRIKICSLYLENEPVETEGFDGIKLCAGRLKEQNLLKHEEVFALADEKGMFISIDLADGDAQTKELGILADKYPNLRIAIGHFGMVTRENWLEQIKLAKRSNIYIESGGITWLFNSEFYPYQSAISAIKEAAAVCGMEKLMWGSDYPRTMVEITYKMSFDFVLKSTELSEKEKELFLYRNAADFYGFNNLSPLPEIKNML